jgi:hypothetical protein
MNRCPPDMASAPGLRTNHPGRAKHPNATNPVVVAAGAGAAAGRGRRHPARGSGPPGPRRPTR